MRILVVSDLRSETSQSPAASYVQGWVLCSDRPVNVEVPVKLVELV